MEEFKLIVAGGRDFADYARMAESLEVIGNQTYVDRAISIVSGMARGADELGLRFAMNNKVKVYRFPAKWDELGKSAGFARNTEMARFADGLLVFWDGQSRGTKHMIDTMRQLGKAVHINRY